MLHNINGFLTCEERRVEGRVEGRVEERVEESVEERLEYVVCGDEGGRWGLKFLEHLQSKAGR